MKTFIIIFLIALSLFISLQAGATNYYFSDLTGNDGRTNAQAQNPSTPWKSLAKLAVFQYAAAAGDSLLLKRGEIFYGPLNINSTYSATYIVVAAYGTGLKPLLTGFSQLSSWSDFGGGKYEASLPLGQARTSIVTINGVGYPMGRYPNADATNGGYLNFQGSSGSGQLTSTALIGGPDRTGAEIVVRKKRFIIDHGPITSMNTSTGTVNFDSPSPWNMDELGFGFFFQNDYGFLDQHGEWYYNATTKKLDIYSTVNPSTLTVKAATLDVLVDVYARDHITFAGLAFEGANERLFYLRNSHYDTIKDCSFQFAGLDGLKWFDVTHSALVGNTGNHIQNDLLFLEGGDNVILNNTFRDIAVWPGMGRSNGSAYIGLFVSALSGSTLIEGNDLRNVGYNPIHCTGSGITVQNNIIDSFCTTLDDGAAIYFHYSGTATNRKVLNNVVSNGLGQRYGTNSSVSSAANGLYADDRSNDIVFTGNTVKNCSENGIMLHNAHEITVTNNTVFGCPWSVTMQHDNLGEFDPIRNVVIKNNIFFNSNSTGRAMRLWTRLNDIASFGTIDSNIYRSSHANPFYTITDTEGSPSENNYSFSSWKSTFSRDLYAKVVVAADDSLKLELNLTTGTRSVALGNKTYLTAKGNGYTGNVSIPPYKSLMLINQVLPMATIPRKGVVFVNQ